MIVDYKEVIQHPIFAMHHPWHITLQISATSCAFVVNRGNVAEGIFFSPKWRTFLTESELEESLVRTREGSDLWLPNFSDARSLWTHEELFCAFKNSFLERYKSVDWCLEDWAIRFEREMTYLLEESVEEAYRSMLNMCKVYRTYCPHTDEAVFHISPRWGNNKEFVIREV